MDTPTRRLLRCSGQQGISSGIRYTHIFPVNPQKIKKKKKLTCDRHLGQRFNCTNEFGLRIFGVGPDLVSIRIHIRIPHIYGCDFAAR